MQLDNFQFGSDLISIQYDGEYIDIHNNFDFEKLSTSEGSATLTWKRCSGDWVPANYPSTLQLFVEKLAYWDVRGEPKEGLSEIGFFDRSTLGKVEHNGLSAPNGEADLLVFRFTNGAEVACMAAKIAAYLIP